MTSNVNTDWRHINTKSLARQFSRLGWTGLWIQFALLTAPILLLVYVLFLSSPESTQRRGIDLSNYLSFGSLLVMLFTTIWFYWYTRLGRRIGDPELCPALPSVVRALWIGLWASCLGIFFSMLLLMSAVGRLLFVLMANPQTGIQFAQSIGADPAQSLSAMDAVSLASLLFVITAELIVLSFSLWLLFRTTRSSTVTRLTIDDT